MPRRTVRGGRSRRRNTNWIGLADEDLAVAGTLTSQVIAPVGTGAGSFAATLVRIRGSMTAIPDLSDLDLATGLYTVAGALYVRENSATAIDPWTSSPSAPGGLEDERILWAGIIATYQFAHGEAGTATNRTQALAAPVVNVDVKAARKWDESKQLMLSLRAPAGNMRVSYVLRSLFME